MPKINKLNGVEYNPRFFYFNSLLDRYPNVAQQVASPSGAVSFFGGEKFDD